MTDAEYTITRNIERYSATDEPSHHWALAVDGEVVAELWVDTETGEIDNIETRAAHRRCGYAGALYRRASSEIAVFHAAEQHRSLEGSAFAEAVGGPSLPHDPTCDCITTED